MTIDNRPTVSIGMPVFNGERFIEEALDSLLAQTFTDFEIVVSDNASTDGTGSICRGYAQKDERVRYFRNRENYGPFFNFNNVFRLSSGRYFKWAASDDVCSHDYLRLAVEVLDRDPAVVLAWGKTRGLDEEGSVVDVVTEFSDLNAPGSMYSPSPTDRFRRLMDDIWWADGPFHGVIRSDVLSQTRLYPSYVSGDKVILAELCLRGRFYEIPEELFYKRAYLGRHSRRRWTLRERAERALFQPIDRGGFLWWRLFRHYPHRVLLFGNAIARAPISRKEKVQCHVYLFRQNLRWLKLRGAQLISGTSPWFPSRRSRPNSSGTM